MQKLTLWRRRLLISASLLILLVISTIITMELALEKGRVSVPNVVGAAVPLARERLKEYHLQGKITGESYHPSLPKGAVISQDPAAGARIKKQRSVSLTISKGSDELFLPDFALQPRDKVRRYLGAKGLALGDLCQVHSRIYPRGSVISQSPPSGTKLHIGEAVSLLVSLGPPEPVYLMPDLIGRDGASISEALMAIGFKVRINFQASFAKERGRIVAQEPPYGSPIARGERIVLVLGKEDRATRPDRKIYD